MLGFDRPGPEDAGLMTGKGKSYCILKKDLKKPEIIEGYIGVQEKAYSK